MNYLPTDLINSNYSYFYDNGGIYVMTNNCSNNMCDTYFVDTNNHYITSEKFLSTSSDFTLELDKTKFTDDIYYRNDLDSILLCFLILCIFCFILPLKIIVRLFRRFQ